MEIKKNDKFTVTIEDMERTAQGSAVWTDTSGL